VAPEMVEIIKEVYGDKEIEDFHLLDTSEMTPLLVKAVQELKKQNEDLVKRIEVLEKDDTIKGK
jgi:hypothetical protein